MSKAYYLGLFRPTPETDEPGGDWKLQVKFGYHSSKHHTIVVPAGFVTDGASIPRWAWSLVGGPMSGRYVWAAVIHDYLYVKHLVKRNVADWIFWDAMRVSGVSFWKRRAMHFAVRVGGWASFRRNAKAQNAAGWAKHGIVSHD